MGHLVCLVSPGACIATSLAKSTLGDVFNALTSWILSSVQWFLTGAGSVLASASEPSTVVDSANREFTTLTVLAAPLMTLGLLTTTLHALRHGDSASLWRAYLGVAPACVLGIAIARPLATLILEAVDQLSTSAATTVAANEVGLTKSLASLATSTPGFALFVLGLLVVVGTWLLWCELIVRTVVLTLLLVLVPIVIPLATFPSGRRLGWRLGETFVALAASKFLIVVTLSLGLDELRGSSATQVITGAVTLLLATCTPFVLLRVIPLVEQSALHNLEGIRSRFTRAATGAPSSPLATVARSLAPDMAMPSPPSRPDDLGLGMWEADSEVSMPSYEGDPPPPPIGTPVRRGGHVAYHQDDMGPVVGWHFDE